jgi:hypothetical protein
VLGAEAAEQAANYQDGWVPVLEGFAKAA